MTESVVEETRTEVRVEEVTETRFRCSVCDMVYDDDQVLRVGLDRQPQSAELFADGEAPRAERTLCHHCAGGLFEYEPNGDHSLSESKTPVGTDFASRVGAYGVVLLLVALPIAVLTTSLAVAGVSWPLVPVGVAAAIGGFLVGWWL